MRSAAHPPPHRPPQPPPQHHAPDDGPLEDPGRPLGLRLLALLGALSVLGVGLVGSLALLLQQPPPPPLPGQRQGAVG